LSGLLVLLLVGAFIYFDRRIGRLERQLEDALRPQGDWHAEPVIEPVSQVEAVAPAPIEPDVPIEEPVILHAQQRPEPAEPEALDVEFEKEELSGGFGFEELFGRRLPIWAGGITLAVAGMLIVKLSIEAGLLSPPVRVFMGLAFGATLIGAAELALRQEERVRDARVRQALAGAGIASLYASVLVAANLYHLIGPLAAMLGMALVTALALGLSLRFGAPSALLGLAGGLAAPALIGSDEPNVALLALYLALAVAGLAAVSRGQRWAWLGISALVGGFGWGIMLLVGGALDAPETISVGLYLLLLGIAVPMFGFAGDWQDKLQLVAAIMAAAQMAALVATGGFALLHWGLFGLISLAMLWLAARDPALGRLPPVGLLIVLLLLGAWPSPSASQFAWVAVIAALIYGTPALIRLWRSDGGLIEAGEIAAITLGGLLLPMFHFHHEDGSPDLFFGLLALGLAVVAGASAARGWTHQSRRDDARFAILATSAAVLVAASATLLLPGWAIGGAIAAVGLALLHLGRLADDRRLEPIAWIFAGAGLIAAPVTALQEVPTEIGEVLRWGLLAAAAAAFAWRARFEFGQMAAQFLAPALLWGALQPIVPERWEPLVAPIMLVALALIPLRLVPALAAATLILLGGALDPIGQWLAGVAPSIMGDPVFVGGVPGADDALLKLLLPALLLGASLWLARGRLRRREWVPAAWAAAALGGIALYTLYKQLFAIGSEEAFVVAGLAERTIWELLLLGAAALLWRFGQERGALAALAAAAAHFALYTLLLHNPLWAEQAVGSLPLLNLLLAAYAVPAAILWAVARTAVVRDAIPAGLLSVAWMILILAFAASMLRQLFHGGILVEPGLSQAEDIARSILAIALAIGFLLWGIRREDRDRRIGSLVLMLAAVAKVFLHDTAGLDGLIRIASFVALGFSLIGIGWLYSRQLAPSKA
jgi:uncharacterized membrane protein